MSGLPTSSLKSGSNGTSIELHNVVKNFTNAAGEFHVLKDLNLSIQKGEFISIVGKSGSGKSTLLNMITGIDHPTSGDVIVADTHIYRMNESKRARWRGLNLGVVFQFFQLLPTLSLHENVMLPMDYCNKYAWEERPERAMHLLRMVGLEEQAFKLPNAVSTGQQQSAAIARALATDPPIIVADEPTGNLDSRSADIVIELFDQLAQSSKTIVMVTHDPSLTERTSRTVIITDGELVNETVAKALPLLTHRQMLAVTKLLEYRTIPPAATIIELDQHLDYFYMIQSGEVEIVLQAPSCPDLIIARLGTGQFFGEVELVAGGRSIASVRAAPESPVELVALHRDEFLKLLGDSPLTEESISRIVAARLEENRSQDYQCDS